MNTTETAPGGFAAAALLAAPRSEALKPFLDELVEPRRRCEPDTFSARLALLGLDRGLGEDVVRTAASLNDPVIWVRGGADGLSFEVSLRESSLQCVAFLEEPLASTPCARGYNNRAPADGGQPRATAAALLARCVQAGNHLAAALLLAGLDGLVRTSVDGGRLDPIGRLLGWAPGGYSCHCGVCGGSEFEGDKRAATCLPHARQQARAAALASLAPKPAPAALLPAGSNAGPLTQPFVVEGGGVASFTTLASPAFTGATARGPALDDLLEISARIVNQSSRPDGELLGVATCRVPVALLERLRDRLGPLVGAEEGYAQALKRTWA